MCIFSFILGQWIPVNVLHQAFKCALVLVSDNASTSSPTENSLRENDADEETVHSAVGQHCLNKEKYNMCEMMFSMERGGCTAAQANQDKPKQNPKDEKTKTSTRDSGQKTSCSDTKDAKKDDAASTTHCVPHDTSKTGHAPWQEGVLERLGRDLTPQEYNMYVVHHGRMLVSFGQIQACTPREKDFVYGSLEPIPVQTLRSFKVNP